ncbi:MAG: alanine racemase [bacterium]
MNFNAVDKKKYDTYAEINLKTLKKNFDRVKKFANRCDDGEVKVCSIVKANAYGHGMNEIGKTLAEYGSDYLGTADYTESIILADHIKKFSKKKVPVLCLGIMTNDVFFNDIVSRNIDVTFADMSLAKKLNDFAAGRNKKVNIQLQVDSGINRIGFSMKDTRSAVKKLMSYKNLKIKGIYSHFATSEIPQNQYAKKQYKEFKNLIKEIEADLIKFELKHVSNSGGVLNYNDSFFNMVRPGVSLYGYYPDRKESVNDIGIEPVMTLRSRVKFIKTLPKGTSISYGRKYFTQEETKIASVPIGYGDGYSRLLTNKSSVMIRGKKYRTAGAICMDWTMVDLGKNSNVKVNDEVIIFGKEYPADNLSEILGTIPYEITCNVSQRVKRIYTE